MNHTLYLLLLLFLTGSACSSSEAQRNNTLRAAAPFTDPRDQQVYETANIGGKRWMLTDLKFESPKSFCYNNAPSNCQQYGRLYTFKEALKACPEGWKLPNEEEWQALEQAMGLTAAAADSIRVWRGTQEGRIMAEQLKVPFAGMARPRGKAFSSINSVARYWVDHPGPGGPAFAMYRMLMRSDPRIYSDQIARTHLLCVRCIEKQ